MKFARATSVSSIARRLRGRFGRRCIILLYHRVAEVSQDPYALCVSPDHFDEQMQVIREIGTPMRLADLASRLKSDTLPERCVCITFDDGYRDNLYAARPILARNDMPATVFITTGRVGRRREFWWDELERVFFEPASLPDRIELSIGGEALSQPLSDDKARVHDDAERWTVADPDPPSPRHAAFQMVYMRLRGMRHEDQTDALDRLLEWAGLDPIVRETHRAMEPEEVRTFADGRYFEIGAHTVTHPDLSSQPSGLQRDEISGSRSTLAEWLGHPIWSFAYPYGNYNDSAVAEVARAGYQYACACMGRPVRRDSDLYLLPRIDAPNCDGEAFSQLLHTCFAR